MLEQRTKEPTTPITLEGTEGYRGLLKGEKHKEGIDAVLGGEKEKRSGSAPKRVPLLGARGGSL